MKRGRTLMLPGQAITANALLLEKARRLCEEQPNAITLKLLETMARVITTQEYGWMLNLAVELRQPLLHVFPDASKVYPSLYRGEQSALDPSMVVEPTVVDPGPWFSVLGS